MGLVSMILVGLVILGGIKRIGKFAATLVPLMCVSYIVAAIVVLVVFAKAIPGALELIFTHAFIPVAAVGGFAGAAVMAAIRFGVARGIFSNEAGLGTAGIAQAAGTTSSPVRSGMIGMLGTFIATLVICTMTGLAIIASGGWTTGESGVALSAMPFESAMTGYGGALLSIALVVFAFTTILGWSNFGERCWEFVMGTKAIVPYRVIWVLLIPFGAIAKLDFTWLLANAINGLMAIHNLLSLLFLSFIVVKLIRGCFARKVI